MRRTRGSAICRSMAPVGGSKGLPLVSPALCGSGCAGSAANVASGQGDESGKSGESGEPAANSRGQARECGECRRPLGPSRALGCARLAVSRGAPTCASRARRVDRRRRPAGPLLLLALLLSSHRLRARPRPQRRVDALARGLLPCGRRRRLRQGPLHLVSLLDDAALAHMLLVGRTLRAMDGVSCALGFPALLSTSSERIHCLKRNLNESTLVLSARSRVHSLV